MVHCPSGIQAPFRRGVALRDDRARISLGSVEKSRRFIEGLTSFALVTDHTPLVPILNDFPLDKLDNPRLLRLIISMVRVHRHGRRRSVPT